MSANDSSIPKDYNILVGSTGGGDNCMENQIKDHLSGVYKDMAEIVSFETVVIIFEHFKGQQVTFPTKLMSKDFAI